MFELLLLLVSPTALVARPRSRRGRGGSQGVGRRREPAALKRRRSGGKRGVSREGQAPSHVLLEARWSASEEPAEHVRVAGDAVATVVVEESQHRIQAVVVRFGGTLCGGRVGTERDLS